MRAEDHKDTADSILVPSPPDTAICALHMLPRGYIIGRSPACPPRMGDRPPRFDDGFGWRDIH